MDKEDFIKRVREELKNVAHDSYVRSTCPHCFGMPIICGSHRCENGWNDSLKYDYKDVARLMKERYELFSKITNNQIDNK